MKGVHDALSRLSGVNKVTVKLQEGAIVGTTDPDRPVLPSAFWKEIVRVGFKPFEMEVRARGALVKEAFVVDGRLWRLTGRAPGETGLRIARLRVREGAEDPPQVEVLE